jgi:hypothetical protein
MVATSSRPGRRLERERHDLALHGRVDALDLLDLLRAALRLRRLRDVRPKRSMKRCIFAIIAFWRAKAASFWPRGPSACAP